MTKYVIIVAVLAASWPQVSCQKPPSVPDHLHFWTDFITYKHLLKLTDYLIEDVTYKLRHADRVQGQHKHSITFELGSIAAAILDKFKHMIEVYRKYANEAALKDEKYDIYEYFWAFHTLQGDYHEIRLERSMFYGIVREFESTRNAITTKFKLPAHFSIPDRLARRRIWSVDPRTFDF